MLDKKLAYGILIGTICIFLIIFFILSGKSSGKKPSETKEDAVKVGSYELKYGTYVGEEEEYDPDTESIKKKKITILLEKGTITIDDTKQSYTVKENSLYVSGTELYEVTGNNEFQLLAGAGITFRYQK